MDRYYTPEVLARELLAECRFLSGASRVVDPSCGAGALLSAAEVVLDEPDCIGIDLDRSVIRSLRVKKPHWHLSVADLLSARSVRRSSVGGVAAISDVVLLNPPFSQVATKFVEYRKPDGEVIRVGRAMGFLLQAADLFESAKGMFAIVPESLIFSELDEAGRSFIGARYEMREIASLKATTFRGARVRCIAVELRRSRSCAVPVSVPPRALIAVKLERGTLPVHLAGWARVGIPFVHSTGLAAIAQAIIPRKRVAAGRNEAVGWALFLPRVGLPSRANVKPVFIRRPLRLSDCVFALWCESRMSADTLKRIIDEHWEDFLNLYRGTGARYVTVSRLNAWMIAKGVAVSSL